MPKKIVVFADGTGNAFSARETNVWRLYEALDQTQPDQIAHYIAGVGTSGFKPFALLDGATGFGVPSNVRKLYRFISWNWEPGDEIYMFGFSRGAFTIRTLVGLIRHEGLIPVKIGNENVPREERARDAMGAWRSYRSETISWKTSLPTIWLTRLVRDAVIAGWYGLMGYRSYAKVKAETKAQGRDDIPIKFIGLFDTVEAYGVPLEEFRRAIDVAIWPISFRNGILCENVETARHALSLDDERVTFHPLRFDMKNSNRPERIKEVWFAGVHTDVGGGYPEDDLAQVPLVWMTNELGDNLRFIEGAKESFANNASPYAAAHDSRSGLAVFYRYGPRTVGDNGGPPVIHHSVAEKIAFGIDRYAPVTLPDTANVLMPDGTMERIKGYTSKWPNIDELPPQMKLAVHAVETLNQPDPAIVSLTLDAIWRRRVAYFLLLFAAFLIAVLPWGVKPVVNYVRDTLFPNPDAHGSVWNTLATIDQGISAFLGSIVLYVSNALPGYARPWIDAVVDRPTASVIVIAVAIYLYAKNSILRDRIADLARQAWVPNEKKSATEDQKNKYREPIPNTPVKKIRESKFIAFIECAFVRYALPTAAILLLYAAIGVAISNSTVTVKEGRGALCRDEDYPSPESVKLEPGKPFTRENFAIDQLCWPSGFQLEQGRHYTLAIEMTDPPFFDQTIMTDIAGFKDISWGHLVTWPIRRWWSADWFQPIAKIGRTGSDAWPLISADGDTAIPTGQDAAGNPMPKLFYEDDDYAARLKELSSGNAKDDPSRLWPSQKIPPTELPAAEKIRAKYTLRKTYVSNFTARSDGELILYVNDAIAAVPLLRPYKGFYDNNTGKAKVTIRRLAAPPP
ncbi:MAG: hypothetical protein QOI05_1534 [Bradyrhizobium sp.]|jgi:hypothetical protein|nr:hypothetical protein [Bradyrhizobium sp.]